MNRLARLLCMLGFHKWDYRTTYAQLPPIRVELPHVEETCSKCGAVRTESGA